MALAGLTMASCTQEHIDVQYIPENAVAPGLGDIQGCALEEDGANIDMLLRTRCHRETCKSHTAI